MSAHRYYTRQRGDSEEGRFWTLFMVRKIELGAGAAGELVIKIIRRSVQRSIIKTCRVVLPHGDAGNVSIQNMGEPA